MPGNVSKSHEVQNPEVHLADDFDACERVDCQKDVNKGRTAKTTSTSDGPTEVGRDATEYDAFEIVQEFSD